MEQTNQPNSSNQSKQLNRAQQWIESWIVQPGWREAVLSQPRNHKDEGATKVKMRPVELKRGGLHVQFEAFVGKQVFHENVAWSDVAAKVEHWMTRFQQAVIQFGGGANVHVTIKKNGQATVQRNGQLPEIKQMDQVQQDNSNELTVVSHNRSKKYIIPEGIPAPFLVALRVMKADGAVVQAMYHKFRQLNRYLEFVQDVLPQMTEGKSPAQMDRALRIIDFGCGKSYLTFALYHFLHVIKGYHVEITGLDLRSDVIATATKLASELQWTGLHFQIGDIGQFHMGSAEGVDLVVSLHACDTATDLALIKAIGWDARVIFAVPCCQHEVARQLAFQPLESMLTHGLFRERFASLWTDALRAQVLDAVGYHTQMIEFIETEHTPKNILLRAVKRSESTEWRRKKRIDARKDVQQFVAQFAVKQTLAEWLLQSTEK